MRLIDADALKRRAQKMSTEAWKMKLTAQTDMVLNQFIDWIDEAQTVGGWISVKERLPEKGEDVLLQFPSNMAVGNFDHGVWFVNSGGNWYTDVCEADDDELPTHWMPLPEPQKEEENKDGDK